MANEENNKVLDELARMAGNTLSAVGSLKTEIEAFIHAKLESYLAKLNLVKREEFDLLKDMLARSRTEQEHLRNQLAELEKRLKH
jgi:BMFP domain-containing protein YqiC